MKYQKKRERELSGDVGNILAISKAACFRDINGIAPSKRSGQFFNISIYATQHPTSWSMQVGEAMHGELLAVWNITG